MARNILTPAQVVTRQQVVNRDSDVPEYTTEEDIKRRQRLIDSIARDYKPVGPYGALASTLTGALEGWEESKLKEETDKHASQNASDLARALTSQQADQTQPSQLHTVDVAPQSYTAPAMDGAPAVTADTGYKAPPADDSIKMRQTPLMEALMQTGNPELINQYAPAFMQARMAQENNRVRTMSPEELSAAGLPKGTVAQIGPDGGMSIVSKAGDHITPLTDQEAATSGLRGKWGRDQNGNLVQIQASDVKSKEAEDQELRMHAREAGDTARAQAALIDNSVHLGELDPDSGSILKQTGMSMPAFYVLTGQASKLPRDKISRDRAFKEAEAFANKNGVDVSTFASQYTANNKVLQGNIERVNATQNMEGEILGTLDNLGPAADAVKSGRLRLGNVAKIWAGQEVNDPLANEYALYLNQLRSELAGYNAAIQGRTGNNITLNDYNEAERVIKNGLSSGGAEGFRTAITSSTDKMKSVLNNSIDRSNKAVWDQFGVGQNYKPKYGQQSGSNTGSKPKHKIERVEE